MTDRPRDYRDDADVDEALDAIRVAPRPQARSLYRACLDTAYHQGRIDILQDDTIPFAKEVRALISELGKHAYALSDKAAERRPQDWIATALAGYFTDKGIDLSPKQRGDLAAQMFLAATGIQGEGDPQAFLRDVFGHEGHA